MAAPKNPGGNAGKGRAKGIPNKITKDIRAMIAEALDKAGGVSYLIKQASANPKAFLTLVGRIIPAQVEATIKRELPEMTRDELLVLLNSTRAAAESGRRDKPSQVH